jgi:hypothetical protein
MDLQIFILASKIAKAQKGGTLCQRSLGLRLQTLRDHSEPFVWKYLAGLFSICIRPRELQLGCFISVSFFFLFVFFDTRTCYVAQAGLELALLLPSPPECWDYRHHQTWQSE